MKKSSEGTPKQMTLDRFKDKHLGRPGTTERDQYEFDLRVEVLGSMIKAVRRQRNLTQEQLGQLIGVQKAQISKLERNTKNVTLDTILKVFEALQAKIKLRVQIDDNDLEIA